METSHKQGQGDTTNHDGSDSGKKQETIYPITSLLTENNPQSSTEPLKSKTHTTAIMMAARIGHLQERAEIYSTKEYTTKYFKIEYM